MNFARLAVAAVAAWVASLFVGYVVNAVLLADLYAQHASVFRPMADQHLALGFLVALLGFFVFAYAYAKGYEGGSGAQEGLRYGVIVGLLIVCFAVVWEYVVFPVRANLLLAWIADTIAAFALYGAIVGAIYRPPPAKRSMITS